MNINDCVDQAITMLKVSELFPDPEQPRQYTDEDKMDELQQSMAAQGIITPLLYRVAYDKNIIVCGERRYEAAKRLGWAEVPARLVLKDHETIALLDNMQRNSLTAMEESLGVNRLLEKPGVDRKQIMDKLGKAESTISEMLKPIKLPNAMQEAALTSAFWSRSKLLKLAGIKDEAKQLAEFEKMKAIVDEKEVKKRKKTENRRADILEDKASAKPKNSQESSDKKIAVFKSHVTKLHERVKKEMTKNWQRQDKGRLKKELEALVKTINEFLSGQPDAEE